MIAISEGDLKCRSLLSFLLSLGMNANIQS
jgi:hypothetical protein